MKKIRLKPYKFIGSKAEAVQVCKNIKKKKKREGRNHSLHHQPKARRRGGRCTLHWQRTNWRAGSSYTSKTWALFKNRMGHVELHVLDLPITQKAGHVVDLSSGDFPMSGEDTPQCWVVNDGALSTGPPPGGTLRTSHPRLPAVPSSLQP